MTESSQNDGPKATLTRRGKTIYETNPSVVGGRFKTRVVPGRVTEKGSALLIAENTGQILGNQAFGFVEEKTVDADSFVKVYLDGIKRFGVLNKAGMLIFEFVYKEISGRAGKDKDTVTLNYYLAQKWKPELSRRTYERGINDLLERDFLFRSVVADVYFVNVRYMFNGDRMVVMSVYRRAGSTLQTELPLMAQEQLTDLSTESNHT